MLDEELIERATKSYYNWCKKNGNLLQIPSKLDSDVTPHGIVTLRNTNGVLATYRYQEKTDRLIRIK